MIFDVKLYVGGKVFTESVHAVNRDDALDTAKARNPKAKVIGVNPTLKEKRASEKKKCGCIVLYFCLPDSQIN